MRLPSWTRHLRHHRWWPPGHRIRADMVRGLQQSARLGYHSLRKVVIALVGGIVVLVGIAMIVLPGPAFIVIPSGLAILALEFPWAQRFLDSARDKLADQWAKLQARRRARRRAKLGPLS